MACFEKLRAPSVCRLLEQNQDLRVIIGLALFLWIELSLRIRIWSVHVHAHADAHADEDEDGDGDGDARGTARESGDLRAVDTQTGRSDWRYAPF